ncbi:VTT domain-containing protein [Fructilactobacillus ixorae]|uniref:VTT domain-containing protein n=1 Tax=Fructilactobacillus ixorae TaxID=1750535 RepID=A0ABY5C3M2_9LACO|nr:VTT domain-containing protein [Fructilactobacillus ixorae]USS93381.1 VTT domain-containing protein [Fructilactobacillus ixorae]
MIVFKDYQPQLKMMFNPAERPEAIHEIRNHGATDLGLLMLLLYLGTVVPGLPVAPIAILAGLCFGTLPGTIMNAISIGLGNLTALRLITFMKNDLEKQYRHNRFANHLKHSKNPLMALVIGYALPIIPSYLVDLQAANGEKQFGPQLIAVAACLGTIPLSIIYALGGNSIFQGNWLEIICLLVFMAIFFSGANWLLQKLATK